MNKESYTHILDSLKFAESKVHEFKNVEKIADNLLSSMVYEGQKAGKDVSDISKMQEHLNTLRKKSEKGDISPTDLHKEFDKMKEKYNDKYANDNNK